MYDNPFIPALMSLLVPGLGQMVLGQGERGAAILLAVIFGGNLNAVWLSLDSAAQHQRGFFWTDKLPRILHDWFAAYGVLFWLWQVADAAQLAREKSQGP